MKRFSIYVIALLCVSALLFSCSKDKDETIEPPIEEGGLKFPKKEMRAVWMATAWGIDWPQTALTEATQKAQYIEYLDKFRDLKINAIYFQVKAMGDAFYDSPYEPWASAITGNRGQNPGYDVLKFLIDEAHARGIEFHAWMNPYRVGSRSADTQQYPPLHSSVNPAWVVNHEKIQIYNPALPEVRERLVAIVKDLVTKYNVDGIHFDDYFYPDPEAAGKMVSDAGDYKTYGGEYATVQDFRRANVDKAIKGVYDVIVATKPEVVFSVSPAPSNAYNMNTLYANVTKWCQEGWVDVVIPQLYQEIGNTSNDFKMNLGFWHQFNYKAALVIGHGFYKFGDPVSPSAFDTPGELEKQFKLASTRKKVVGSAMYSAKYIMMNRVGITDKLRELYAHNAVMPFVGREVAPKPTTPTNLVLNGGQLSWTVTGANQKSVVYHFADLKAVGKVVAVTDDSSLNVTENGFYCVTTINIDNLESKATETIEKK